MIEFVTRSGSTYQMDIAGKRIRRLVRADASKSERMGAGEWRGYEHADLPIVGHPVWIRWGTGRDAISAQIGTPSELDDEAITRATHTTEVVEVREVAAA